MANLSDYYRAPGIAEVGQYQMSSIPWATSSIELDDGESQQIKFYNITNFVTIINNSEGANAELRVGWSENGVEGPEIGAPSNYFVLNNGESYTGEWRIASLWLLAGGSIGLTASVVAGLTGIPTASLPGFTNWSGNEGVG